MPATQTDRIGGLTTSVAVKAPVRVATTGPVVLSGIQTIDGVLLQAGDQGDIYADRVLVKNQDDPVDNGIYKVSDGTWTRAGDFNGAFDAVEGTLVYIVEGSTYGDSYYRVISPNPIYINISDIVFELALGGLQLPAGLSDPLTVYLVDSNEYNDTRFTDAAPAIQALINSFAAGTNLKLIYPSGDTYQSDVQTNGRSVRFTGQTLGGTNIIPVDITFGTFRLDDVFSTVEYMTINDNAATFDDPTWTPNMIAQGSPGCETRALILVGKGGNTNARNCYLNNIRIVSSRGQGIRWEGGSFLVRDKVVLESCGSGGFYSPDLNGDCNHFKSRNSSATRCFLFAERYDSTTNNGSAGYFEAAKFFENQNVALYMSGSANSGAVFLEGTNGSGEGVAFTRTFDSFDVSVPLARMPSLQIGQALNNGSMGFPNGTYITDINYVTRTVTLSQKATSSGTTTTKSFTGQGNRVPSIWFTNTAYGNMLNVVGDSLDPLCFRDDNIGTVGRNIINYAINSSSIIYDNNGAKFRLTGIERGVANPNASTYFATNATLVSGSADIVLADSSILYKIRTGAPVTSPGFTGSSTVASVNIGTSTLTLASGAVVTGNGAYQITIRPNQRGGLLTKMFDDVNIMTTTQQTNLSQKWITGLGRGARFIGVTASASNQLTLAKRYDEENEAVANGKTVYCSDPTIIPDGTLISSFTGNDATGYTITMSQNALLDRTGVEFWMGNNTRIAQVWPNTNNFANNTLARGNNLRIEEIYRTVTGDVRMAVQAASDGNYLISWDPSSVSSLGFIKYSTDGAAPGVFTSDTNGKALVNVAIGDNVNCTASRDSSGLRIEAKITAANTMDIQIFNESPGAINLGLTSFFIKHTPK